MRQVWRHLGFLHWPIDRAAIAALLPPGLTSTPSTASPTSAWSRSPFRCRARRGSDCRSRPPFTRAQPAHLRASRRPRSRRLVLQPGRSEPARRRGRAARLSPAVFSRPGLDGDLRRCRRIGYRSRRLGAGQTAEFSGRYGPTGPAAPAAVGSLEFFLAERYLLYAWNGRALSSARVHHAPYPLQPAAAFDVRQSLTGAADLPPLDGPPRLVHYAREVDVCIDRPRRCG